MFFMRAKLGRVELWKKEGSMEICGWTSLLLSPEKISWSGQPCSISKGTPSYTCYAPGTTLRLDIAIPLVLSQEHWTLMPFEMKWRMLFFFIFFIVSRIVGKLPTLALVLYAEINTSSWFRRA